MRLYAVPSDMCNASVHHVYMESYALERWSARDSIAPIWMSSRTVLPRSRDRVTTNSSSSAASDNLPTRRDSSMHD